MVIVSNVVSVTSMLETFTASGTSEGRETQEVHNNWSL